MTTGDKFLSMTENRILGVESFKDHLADVLKTGAQQSNMKLYHNSGTFWALGLAADGNDKFKLTGFMSGEIDALDGLGNFLGLAENQALCEDVLFENTDSTLYYVALQMARVPGGLFINPVDGLPTWDYQEEKIGWEGTPNSVVDNGNGTMTFVVNNVTEAGVSHVGRQVAVYKLVNHKNALAEAVALETCAVTFSGGNNKITTAGVFGQGAAPSTTAAHYAVVLLGPRVSRGTNLSTLPEWCFVGTVTGAGAGNPPSVFSTSGQNVFSIGMSDLSQITRYASNGRLKVEVKALGSEIGEDQIRVVKFGSPDSINFKVDELGNVTILGTLTVSTLISNFHDVVVNGDLEVKGLTTQRDVETVYSNEIITGTLTVGDANTDVHVAKGEWHHHTVAGADVLTIDSLLSRIGLGGAWDTGPHNAVVKVTGKQVNTADILPFADGGGSLGDASYKWLNVRAGNIYVTSLAATFSSGNLTPISDNTYDLGDGSTPREWKDLYIDGVAYVDTLSLDTTDGLGISTTVKPATNIDLDLGGTNRAWRNLYLGSTDGQGIANTLKPMADSTIDLGGTARFWRALYVSEVGGQGFGNSVVPTANITKDLGASSYAWRNLYLGTTDGMGLGTHLKPMTDGDKDLGGSLREWKDLYIDGTAYVDTFSLSSAAGEGVVTDLVPTADGSKDLGGSSYQWKDLWVHGTAYVDTLSLDASAGLGVSTDVVPTVTATKYLGNTDYVWAALYAGYEYLKSTAPGIRFIETGVAVDEGIWTLSVNAGTLVLATWNDSMGSSQTILEVARTGYVVDHVSFWRKLWPYSDNNINLGDASYRWGNVYGGNGRFDVLYVNTSLATDLIPSSTGSKDLGATAAHFAELWVNSVGCSMAPLTNGDITLGSASYRFGKSWFSGIEIRGTTLNPIQSFYMTTAAAGERRWLLAQQDKIFGIYLGTDGDESIGTPLVEGFRSAGALTSIAIGQHPTAPVTNAAEFYFAPIPGPSVNLDFGSTTRHWNKGWFDSIAVSTGVDTTLLPSGAFNLGSAGARWTTVFAAALNASGTATVDAVAATNGLGGGSVSVTGNATMRRAIVVSDGSTQLPMIKIRDTNAGTDHKNVRIESDENALYFRFYNDAEDASDNIFTVDHTGSVHTVAGINVGAKMIPDATGFDLGSSSLPWNNAYAEQLVLSDDNGGTSGKTTITGSASFGPGTGTGQVRIGSGTNTSNDGFLKIYVGVTVYYIPYWAGPI